ncbi:MAG: SH3 domain-containing protein [Anaerolineaceae bacterium]|nr:SH3 domain-containing protein [Anaerolineaceae bacterium]
MRKTGLILLGVLLIAVMPVLGQEQCALLFQSAVDMTQQGCAETGRNQVCYGYAPATPDPRPNVRLVWAEPGDIVDASALSGFSTEAFDPESEAWGIALAKVRANLPDGVVTMLTFGDVQVENASEAPSDAVRLVATVEATNGANVRAEPNESGPLSDILSFGQSVEVLGRTGDNAWLWVVVPGTTGWVSAGLVRADFDLNALPVVDSQNPGSPYFYGTLQAFNFESSPPGERPCNTAPDNGILVQTPDLEQEVMLVANTLELHFAGTLWLETPAPVEVTVSVLEGHLWYGEERLQTINAGERLHFAYDGRQLTAAAQPEDYAFVRARYLPLPLLPREFALPFALGDVVFPFEPGSGFLTSIPLDAACVAAWAGDVNLRGGPGTAYPLRQGVPGGYYAYPDARAINGGVWWRLAEGIWIAADVTVTAGDCGNLPLVDPPPLPN